MKFLNFLLDFTKSEKGNVEKPHYNFLLFLPEID